MNYWIFKTNPEKYDIDARLKDDFPITTWQVTRYKNEITTGDIAFIWKTGPDRGLCGVIEVISPPVEMEEIDPEKPYCIDLSAEKSLRVFGRFLHFGPFTSYRVLKVTSGLENLSVFRGFQMGTNFPVTQDEGRILMTFFR